MPLGTRPQAKERNFGVGGPDGDEAFMNARMIWSRILVIIGCLAMVLGAIDPLEGSLLILPGSGMVALGMLLGQGQRRILLYWVWVFILIAVGVGAMFVVSAFGGIGGRSGHSLWWGVLILPYPVGWILGFAGAISALIRFFKARSQRAQC